MKNRNVLIVALCVLVAGALVAAAGMTEDEIALAEARKAADVAASPQHHFSGTLEPRTVGTPEAGPGTIQYDTGTFTGVGDIPAVGDNFSFGNRFNTYNGNPIPLPITVTQVSVYMAMVDGSSTGTGNAFATVYGPLNTAGTNAAPIQSPLVAMSAGTFNVVSYTAATITGTGNGSFLAGVWNPTQGTTSAPTPCGNDCVGFDSNGTVFHGFAMEDLNGGNFTPIAANALLRVSGNVVPVELMNFTIQ